MQELGSSDGRVPARSFLGRAAMRVLPGFAADVGAVLGATFKIGVSGLRARFARRLSGAVVNAKAKFGR